MPVANVFAAADDSIHLTRTDASFRIQYGTGDWTCLLAWFGPLARHSLGRDADVSPSSDPVEIAIKPVSFSGSELSFNLTLTVRFVDGRAALALTIPELRIRDEVDLIDWLSNARDLSGNISAARAASIAKALDHRSLAAGGPAVFSFAPNGRFALHGLETPISFRANGVRIPVRTLRLAIGKTALPSRVPALELLAARSSRIPGYEADDRVTVLWAEGPMSDGAGGRFASSKTADLELDAFMFEASDPEEPHLSMVLADLSPTSRTCVVAKSFNFEAVAAFSARKDAAERHVREWPDFKLEMARLNEIVWGKHSHSWLTGNFRSNPAYKARGHVPLTISGGPELGLWAESADDALTAFTAKANLHHAFVPLPGADYSRIDFEQTQIDYALEELQPDRKATLVAAGYMLGSPPLFSAVMGERAMVRVLRTADLLSLKYSFRDLYLVSKPGDAYLDSCENCLPGFKLPVGRDPLMIVRFPPQHITEKAYLVVENEDRTSKDVRLGTTRLYETTGGNGNAELANAARNLRNAAPPVVDKIKTENLAAAQNERDKDLKTASMVVDELLKSLDHVTEARSAGPTRLVFAFSPEAHEADPATRGTPFLPRPYTVRALSYWRGLKAKVAARALRRDASLAEQLRISGVTVDTEIRDKTYAIDRALTRPTAEDSAMEIPYRLQLSTANDARWHTPPELTDERIAAGIMLWSARLDPDLGGKSVRALWSPDFDKARPGFFSNRKHPSHSNEAPWRDPPRNIWESACDWLAPHSMRMSLDARDRHELVLLSSVYGLPALLPVPDPVLFQNPSSTDDEKRAESTVFPLPKDYIAATGLLGDEGIFAPQALSSADIALSSLGATVNLQGQWEPPSGFTMREDVQPLWPALTIERWQHQAFLGRDVFVEVVYKGFLFPLGHRCSVIKSTERKFRADPRDRSGKAPVAYLIQRYFVVVGEPRKSFPAVSQRYGGRAFYTTAITVLTTTSPDIVDPFDKGNMPGTFGEMGGAAFFPKTQPGNKLEGVIQFEYEVEYSNGDKRKLKSPLIVVDNTLAHDPLGVSKLVAFYNGLMPAGEVTDAGRRVDTANQRMRYADDSKAGSTEFATRDWLLGAQGREVSSPVGTSADPSFQFTMNAVMEGADQPPFYPVVAEAQVEVQSLNYMNGQSRGFTAAGYDLNYLHYGFSPAKNPSGIFLSLLNETTGRRPTDLVVDGNTAVAGGFVTPNIKSVALSLQGPVGGKTATMDLNSALGDGSMTAGAGDTGSDNFELSTAQAGQFDGLEALVGALKLPKLFAIIPLQSVVPILSFIDGAPEMIESTTYKITENVEEFADEAANVASRITAAVDGATGQLDHNLADYSAQLGIAPAIKFADLYPRLAGAFVELRTSLAKLQAAASQFQPNEASKAFAALGATASAIRKTLAEIKAVAKSPTPAIVDTFITKLNDALKMLGESLRDAVLAEIRSYVSELNAALIFSVTLQCDLVDGKPGLNVTVIDPPNTDLQHTLYPFLIAILVGRPDNWQIVDGDGDQVGRQVVRFDITKFGTLDPTQALQVGEQTLEHSLLNKSVTKPLIDGYVSLSRIAQTFEKDAGDIERHLRELPRQLTVALISWAVGVMGLERVYALAHEFLAEADPQGLLSDVLKTYADPLVKLPSFTTQADNVNLALGNVIDALDLVLDDPRVPPGMRSAISQARVRVAKLRQRLDATLDDFEVLRKEFAATAPSVIVKNATPASLAGVSANVAAALGKFTALQAVALEALKDTIAAAQEALTIVHDSAGNDVSWVVLQKLAGTLAAAEQSALRFVGSLIVDYNKTGTLVSPAKHILDKVDQEIDAQLDTAAGSLMALTDKVLDAAVNAARLPLSNPPTEDEVTTLLGEGLSFLTLATDAFAKVTDTASSIMGLATRGMTLGLDALNAADKVIFPRLQPILVKALTFIAGPNTTSLYGLAHDVNSKLNPATWDATAVKTLKLFLDKKLFDLLADPTIGDAIISERKMIDEARAAIESATSLFDFALPPGAGPRNTQINALIKLSESWIKTTAIPAPARALEPARQLADLLLHGKIADLVDLDGLSRELEDALRSFIPAQVSFDYEWGVPLKSFPSESSKIFWIDQTRRKNKPNFPSSDAFKDKLATRKDSNDLTLYARAGVDLRDPAKPKPIFQAEGDIRFFNINLFSPSFDVVTVRFDQLRFTLDETGSNFHVILAKDAVTFGPVVQFIQAMSGFLGGKSGIYLHLIFNPLGIVIGYHYEQERIPLGTLALLNFAIDISIELTFDGSPVAFRFALAARNKPLTIICTPYGGAGYLSLQTVASDIVDFQMQLEFGGAVAITFGPLNANGFVSAGIYIEKHKGQDLILEGFVRAIGEGTIVCFTIAVFFEVRIRQVGSNVTGQLTVTVSFKVGFVKISYSYTAQYQFSGGGSGGQSLLAEGKVIKVDVANRVTNWKRYRQYFSALAKELN
ncbi:hypothetical protein NKI91_22190 [Mesorhizobium sp. M0312]|uniref:hypothetical protein n=1 Tax=Mesorhizobium sp. M0312 TaxID=2956934 RepID=UPI00333696A7